MRRHTDDTHRDGTSILARLRSADSVSGRELEQAILRLLTVGVVSGYLLLASHGQTYLHSLLYPIAGSIWLGAIVFLLLAWFRVPAGPGRRLFATLYDTAAISVAMYVSGPDGAPLYPLYLAVALGNGFRFGIGHLYLATSLGLIGFSLVVFGTAFWVNHLALSVGLMLGLALLPLYVAKLLQRGNREAERSVRTCISRGMLLDNIAQEMRAPLSEITGMSDLLRETSLNRSQREFAEAIGDSAGSLATLLENVSDYARLESGALRIVHADFDLHNVLNGTVRTLRPHGQQRDLRINLNVEPEVPFALQGDPHRLRQILTNLLVDMIRRSRYGRIDVRVRPKQIAEIRTVLRFELQSCAAGAAKNPPGPGQVPQHAMGGGLVVDRNGLALAIARTLIARLGGVLDADDDQQSDDVTVAFELPFDRQLDVPESAQSLDHTRLLIVSDPQSPHLGILSEWLRTWRVQFDVVETASAAFVRAESELKRDNPYHVVLVDKPLIDIDAYQFARAMRKVASPHHTSLLLIAREGRAQHAEALRDAGFACLLDTPLDKRLVFNALHCAPALDGSSRAQVVALRSRPGRGREPAKTRILVAEDNPTNQKFVARVLNRAGHDVDVVHNGEEALDALEMGDYDLVIVDMHMPVMDGVQTAKLYRFIHPTRPRVPFVMLTASATTEAKLECEAAGIETFLTKPVEASRLLEVVDQLVAQPSRSAAERDARPVPERTPATEIGDPHPVLNLASLQEVQNLGYGTDFFHELIQGFIRDGNGMLQKMEDALAQQDYDDFRDAGQALKGNSGSIGAVKLYKCCVQIERMSRADYELMGKQLTNDIRTEFRRACSALIEYSKQLGNNVRN